MIDFARIAVRAGDGGVGSGSFHHIRGKRYGKADGGDGGRGGDVYCEATNDLNTLERYRYVKDYRAQNGANGLSNRRRGAVGEDLVLKVPVGTVVTAKATEGTKVSRVSNVAKEVLNKQSFSSNKPLRPLVPLDHLLHFDLTQEGQKILVARGGEGGRGNAKLRDEFGRRPKAGEQGQAGEFVKITLEQKLIADVGLIGLPNVGKSTLLAALTKATPKIADYPFTTLEPNLGVLDGSQFTVDSSQNSLQFRVDSSQTRQNSEVSVNREQRTKNQLSVNREPITVNKPAKLVLADIPGLIEGASKGRGLGDLFLRHIERTKVLAHLVEVTKVSKVTKVSEGEKGKTSETFETFETFDTSSLWQDYQTVRNELKVYSKELAKKREIIVLTKIDLVDGKTVDEVAAFFGKRRKKVIATSAKTGEGLADLVKELQKLQGTTL